MLVIVEDSLEILAVYENIDDFRTNDLKEEELFQAKKLCLNSLSLCTKSFFVMKGFILVFALIINVELPFVKKSSVDDQCSVAGQLALPEQPDSQLLF